MRRIQFVILGLALALVLGLSGLGFSEEEAREEAKRCLRCDLVK